MKIAIVGNSMARQLGQTKRAGKLPEAEGVPIRGWQSAPIFIQGIIEELEARRGEDVVYLFVTGSQRFNHLRGSLDAEDLSPFPQGAYEAEMGSNPWLFDKALLNDPEAVSFMDEYLGKWVVKIREGFPNVRFIFWCEFILHLKRKPGSSPVKRLQYLDWAELAGSANVDLDAFAESFDVLANLKDFVHPNLRGQKALLSYLKI